MAGHGAEVLEVLKFSHVKEILLLAVLLLKQEKKTCKLHSYNITNSDLKAMST